MRIFRYIAKFMLRTGLLLFLLLLAAFAFLFFTFNYLPYHGEKFDRNLWDQRLQEERCGMYSDIKNNVLKTGMSKQDIRKLLGNNYTVLDAHHGYGNHYAYEIGFCGSLDATFLVAVFDQNGRLAKVTTYQN